MTIPIFQSLLSGGGGGVDPTGLDILAAEGGLLRRRGKRMFHSTFQDGSFDGWRDHYDGVSPRAPIGLTRYPVMSGTHALMVSTGSVPYFADNASNSTGCYKNLSLPRETGLVSFSGFFAQASDASNTAGSSDVGFDNFGLFFDTQRWGDTSRRFYQVSYMTRAGSASPAWVIREQVDGVTQNTIIPNSGGITAGINERKWNFNYIRLTANLSGGADGLGGYVELQVNSRVFDLRGFGSPVEPPQTGSAMDTFSGGFNAGIGLLRSWRVPAYTENALVCDDLVVTFNDARNF